MKLTTEKKESEIQKEVIKAFEARGCIVIRMNSGYIKNNVRLAPVGTPDLAVVGGFGQILWVEVKAPGKQLRDSQVNMIERLEALGHRVYVVRDVEEVAGLPIYA